MGREYPLEEGLATHSSILTWRIPWTPAETCAGGWGLILRVWVPAHSLNSGEAAPEARPAGGALRARLHEPHSIVHQALYLSDLGP